MPEQDPRQATPRPRPAGTAATGQHPVARTRDTPAGPTGTARIPIVRQSSPGPVAPRPGQRQQEGSRQPDAQRASTQPPVRSRLRAAPPAPPQQPRPFQQASPQQLQPQSRPTARPEVVRPFSQLSAVPTPQPPAPPEFHAAPETKRRRRPVRGLLAVLAVVALAVLWGLPAFASEALDAPPVAGIEYDGSGDLQHLRVGSDVRAGSAETDAVSGSLPVAAAPSWLDPVNGRLGDPFGPRPEQPVPGVSLFHRGQDIVAPCGAAIRAAASGTVTAATYWGTYGDWILIDHGDGVAVGYAHESQMLVSVGQKVAAGQVIGRVGQTGAATGCHLHLEVHLNSVAVNPVPFFAGKGIRLR